MFVEIEYKKHIYSTQQTKDSRVKDTPTPTAMAENEYQYRSEHPRSYWLSGFFFPQGECCSVP